MTIFFSGHTFKYEIEGVCKLFFPLMRFTHVYEDVTLPEGENYILTRRRKGRKTTLLWVRIALEGEGSHAHTRLDNGEPAYEKECERLLCVLVHRLLSRRLGVSPSWGILTGVRPVNIIQKERLAGSSEAEIEEFFRGKYLVSREKYELARRTADVQAELLRDIPPRSYSLYVGIPFCASRCSYCSFVSHAITTKKATDRVDDYVALLCVELAETAALAKELGLTLDTIYMGGGTPTALTAEQLRRVTDAIGESFDVAHAREYTIEAGRADTITPEKLRVIRSAGADRISVNPQTFSDSVLRAIGRRHTAQQAEDAYYMAREAGFSLINMDFIAGLPTDTYESFCQTMDRALELAPANITVHTLSIKRSADLFQEREIVKTLRADATERMTAYAREQLMGAGYQPYYLYRQKNTVGNLENVGFSKPGTENLYNVYIMDEIQTILSCGAGGVTKLVGRGENPIQRVFNYKYHFEYIDRFDEIRRRKEQVKQFYEEHSE